MFHINYQRWVSTPIWQSGNPNHSNDLIWRGENPNHNKKIWDLPFPITDLIWWNQILFNSVEKVKKQAMSMGLLSFFFNMGSFKCVHSPNLAYKLGSGEWFDKRFEIYPNHPLILHSQIIINSWLHLSDCQAKISILLIWEKSGIFNSSVIWYPSLTTSIVFYILPPF